MQRTDDRQRSLAAHAAVVSDPRLPSHLTDVRELQKLEGRVLGHGEEESSGRTYMMLEGTDHQVHFIYRSPELETARLQGKLNANSFVRLNTRLVGQKFTTNVQYFGDSNQLLSNKHFFRSSAQRLIKRGVVPVENGTAGWLGKYETRLSQAFQDVQRQLTKPCRKNR